MPVDAPPAASGSERVVLGMVWEGFTAGVPPKARGAKAGLSLSPNHPIVSSLADHLWEVGN